MNPHVAQRHSSIAVRLIGKVENENAAVLINDLARSG